MKFGKNTIALGALGFASYAYAASAPAYVDLGVPMVLSIQKPCGFGANDQPELLSPAAQFSSYETNFSWLTTSDIKLFNAKNPECKLKDDSVSLAKTPPLRLNSSWWERVMRPILDIPVVMPAAVLDTADAPVTSASPVQPASQAQSPSQVVNSNQVQPQARAPAPTLVPSRAPSEYAPSASGPISSNSAPAAAPPLAAPAQPSPPSNQQAVVQVSQLPGAMNHYVTPPPNQCVPPMPTLGASSAVYFTPQAAITLALSEPLQLVGRAMIDNETIPSCAFKNSKVTVVYDYCAKGTTGEVGMTITTSDGRSVHFHVASESENGQDAHRNVADVSRYGAGYPANWAWTVDYAPGGASSAASFAEISSNQKSLVNRTVCSVGRDAGGYNASSNCYAGDPSLNQSWLPSAQSFSAQPPSQWFQLVNNLEVMSDQASAGTH